MANPIRSGLSRRRSWPRTGITLNSAPVRVKALAKLTRLTRRNPTRPARIRSCAANGGAGAERLRGARSPERHRLGDPEPGDHAREQAGDRIGDERGRQAEALGQHPSREGSEADREQKAALVDGHRAPAHRRRGDVGQHDLAGREDERRPDAGHEPGAHERGVVRGVRAEEIARGRHEPAEGEGRRVGRTGRRAGPPARPRGTAPGRRRRWTSPIAVWDTPNDRA